MARAKLYTNENIPDGSGLRIAVVAARFNSEITEKLTVGTSGALEKASVRAVKLFKVPGCFELPLAVKKLAESGHYDAIVALGAIIRGETPHFDYVAAETAAGLARASYETGVPVAFGVLTTENIEQALDRAGGKLGNKGAEAAYTAVEMARTVKSID
jgi:6,7-dimethyl-8-ribityllumazine synthase